MAITSNQNEPQNANVEAALSVGAVTAEERRDAARTPKVFSTHLLGVGRADILHCKAQDISEGGLYVRVPSGCDVTVGQRFEVTLADEARSSDLTDALSDGCYATVIRTQHCDKGAHTQVGAGLRFDQPLLW